LIRLYEAAALISELPLLCVYTNLTTYEDGGVKGGRCRVLLLLYFKTANQAAMET